MPGAVNIDSQLVFSLTSSLGTRVKLGEYSDIVIEGKWQYYFSDEIDGLNAKVPENKANDWSLWANIGYIYYLN